MTIKSLTQLIVLLALLLFVVGCSESVPEIAASTTTPEPTNTAIPEPTDTATPEPTDMATPEPTDTATPEPTDTPSPTPTVTYTPSATATQTNTPTVPPVPATVTPLPTATPDLPDVTLYQQTPTQPWDSGTLIHSVTAVAESTHEFLDYFGTISVGAQGQCFRFFHFYGIWERQPAFTDIPDDWLPYYHEHRQILHELRMTVLPISAVCGSGGGTIDEETDQATINSLHNLRARAEQLQATIPR